MFKVVVIGTRSKMGNSILSNTGSLTILAEEALEKEKVDFLFLASSKERNKQYLKQYKHSPEIKIFDYSGLLKERVIEKDPLVTYGFLPLYEKNKQLVAMPGCSSLAMLNALYPLKHLLAEEIFIDVKFPKTSLKHNSPNLTNLDLNIKGILYNQHPHQEEVCSILQYPNITIAPSLVDVPSGISVNIFLPKVDFIETNTILLKYYEHSSRVMIKGKNPLLSDVIRTGETHIFISPSKAGTVLNVVSDNLINNRFLDFL